MGKIVLMVPRESMLYLAHNVLGEKQYEIDEMMVTSTSEVVKRAKEAIQNGAEVIIARGVQASLIKRNTEVPVAEIVLTAQEMGLLVTRAKALIQKEKPAIAVVGFKNMFCDMTYFEQLYQVDLRTYFAKDNDTLEQMAKQAAEDGADVIIGGDIAVRTAKWLKVPSLFLSATEDSIRNAFEAAKRIRYAIETEKRNAAQFATMLDYSFGGMLQTDREGRVIKVNPGMEGILKSGAENLEGNKITHLMPELDQEKVDEILRKGGDNYSFCIQIHQTAVYGILAPVVVDGRTEGAFLSCHKVKTPQNGEKKNREAASEGRNGKPALGRFSDLISRSEAMKNAVSLARLYSQSERPVLICGEVGTETWLMAQGIHNNGSRGSEAFIEMECEGLSGEEQEELLFGRDAAASQASDGTLLIHKVSQLSLQNQFHLYRMMTQKYYVNRKTSRCVPVNVRILAEEEKELSDLVREGKFRPDLAYLLSGLTLTVPPLRERPEDLEIFLETYIERACDCYGRYHVLTQGAKKRIYDYPWPGNRLQLEAFCDRLILTARKRSLDEIQVSQLLETMYPKRQEEDARDGRNGQSTQKRQMEPADGEGKRLLEALEKCRGNRMQAARELGISKTTLWRRMKQYGIEWNEK